MADGNANATHISEVASVGAGLTKLELVLTNGNILKVNVNIKLEREKVNKGV
jgi:hypothetical protein